MSRSPISIVESSLSPLKQPRAKPPQAHPLPPPPHPLADLKPPELFPQPFALTRSYSSVSHSYRCNDRSSQCESNKDAFMTMRKAFSLGKSSPSSSTDGYSRIGGSGGNSYDEECEVCVGKGKKKWKIFKACKRLLGMKKKCDS